MRKLVLFCSAVALAWTTQAKPIDLATARRVGYNFLRNEMAEGLTRPDALELAYTSESATGVKYFYVFNNANTGFVMVAADDQVIPVFAYSKEAGFQPGNIPEAAATWLNNYAGEIALVIEKDYPASAEIKDRWEALKAESPEGTGNKTTISAVSPLLSTKWNQSPFYNELCPFDVSAGKNAPTGCVATAMAQIMKFWNYPSNGTGTHSYNHWNYGTQSADFGNTTYQWSSMPNTLSGSNNPVATLMYHAGVAVEMGYTANSSGAYVASAMGYPSAESALVENFGYNSSLHAEFRQGTQSWISLLKSELNEARPLLYAGFGSGGGHVWIADGYDNNNFFHINWGWGGVSDGYYAVDNMNPPALGAGGGSGGFYSNQHAIIGIQPTSAGTPDKYEQNNFEAVAYGLPVVFSGNTANPNTESSTLHNTNDIDYYSIFLPIGDNYTVTARLHDAANSGNGKTYTVDAKVAVKPPTGATWSSYFEDVVPATLTINGGGTVQFKVISKEAAAMGTYLLDINVNRTTTGVTDVRSAGTIAVYPNPASNIVNIDLRAIQSASKVSIVDIQGRSLYNAEFAGGQVASVPVSSLPNGMYFVRIQSENNTVTEKISINR